MTADVGLTVARDNKEVLTFHHVEALILFTQDELMVPLKQLLKAQAQGAWLSKIPMNQAKRNNHTKCTKTAFTVRRKSRKERFIKEYFLSGKFEEFFKTLKEKNLAKGDASWVMLFYHRVAS